MTFIGWLDYDEAFERATRNALADLRGRDARDELGLGGVRDTLSDLFFPGTSTVQQRLRYFLLVAWCCEAAFRDHRPGRSLVDELRVKEIKLIDALKHLGEGKGVIGLQKGADLVSMPSSIYWTGLRLLDVVTTRGSIARWARFAESRRASDRPPPEEGPRESRTPGLAGDLPPIPPGFLEGGALTFDLDGLEREFLRRRLTMAASSPVGLAHNLFHHFVGRRVPEGVEAPWLHPRAAGLPPATARYLRIAAAFSTVMEGATLLYNYLLCLERIQDRAAEAERHRDDYARRIASWADTLVPEQVALLTTGVREVAAIAPALGHGVGPATLEFIERWAGLAAFPRRILTSGEAHALVRQRETSLKRGLGTSRFENKRVRENWRYASGTAARYRWDVARSYLNDLAGMAGRA